MVPSIGHGLMSIMYNYSGVSGTKFPRKNKKVCTSDDDDPDNTGNDGDSDGNDQDEDDMDPICQPDNTVSRDTLDLIQEHVKGIQDKPYCT